MSIWSVFGFSGAISAAGDHMWPPQRTVTCIFCSARAYHCSSMGDRMRHACLCGVMQWTIDSSSLRLAKSLQIGLLQQCGPHPRHALKISADR